MQTMSEYGLPSLLRLEGTDGTRGVWSCASSKPRWNGVALAPTALATPTQVAYAATSTTSTNIPLDGQYYSVSMVDLKLPSPMNTVTVYANVNVQVKNTTANSLSSVQMALSLTQNGLDKTNEQNLVFVLHSDANNSAATYMASITGTVPVDNNTNSYGLLVYADVSDGDVSALSIKGFTVTVIGSSSQPAVKLH